MSFHFVKSTLEPDEPEKGPEAALETIGEAVTVKDRLFKAGILLALEKYSQVEDELYDITSNKDDIANMWRLRSLVHLAQGSLGAALKSIRKAKEAVPDSYIIKYIEGGLSFYSALSPAACPQQLLTYSDPIDWLWVRRDDTSQSSLRFSEQIFVDIEDACELTEEQRLHVQSWQLACLACQPDRTEEAEEYCRSLLSTDRTNPHAIAWAVNRGYFSDQVLQKSYVVLEEELELVPGVSTIIRVIPPEISCSEK